MSLELSPEKFEITSDVDGRMVLDHTTKLIPVVQKVSKSDVDLAFPNPPLGVTIFNRADGLWRICVWGLQSNGGVQSGFVNLGAINPGIAPNLILANVKVQRVVNPKQNIWGSFIKAVPENVWMPVRRGMRLEYTSWLRRIAWLSIEAGQLRLNWKQSSKYWAPSYLDPNWNWAFPQAYMYLKVPPSYQISNFDREGNSRTPDYPGTPSIHAGPAGTIGFESTWRFQINAQLLQV